MGMIPIDQPPARPASPPQHARSKRQPEPELRDRFEDAMAKRRKAGSGATERFSGETPAPTHGHAQPPVTGQQAFEGHGEHPRKGKQIAADTKVSEAAAATPQQSAPVAAADPTPVSAPHSAALSASFADIVARMDMPTSATGGETLLTMSDTRWLATQAVIARDDAGGLMLDIDARGEDAEKQREALKARLEARGHRVGEIRING
ncbi:hypothetical protein FHS96_000541 [Sphingomonas zeicaulis]|uniref:hypothetical protein n=1 Tax=Sphingomonas zeicaulis TaxID=1632740 RepID=UPI003D2094E2